MSNAVAVAKSGPAAYWAAMSPEERSKEMRRRGRVGRARAAAGKLKRRKAVPRDKQHTQAGEGSVALDTHAAYLFGKTEALIEYYAAGAGVPRAALALRVAELLRRKEGGSVLGSQHRVSRV